MSTETTKGQPRTLSTAEGFVLGGIAACVAVRVRVLRVLFNHCSLRLCVPHLDSGDIL